MRFLVLPENRTRNKLMVELLCRDWQPCSRDLLDDALLKLVLLYQLCLWNSLWTPVTLVYFRPCNSVIWPWKTSRVYLLFVKVCIVCALGNKMRTSQRSSCKRECNKTNFKVTFNSFCLSLIPGWYEKQPGWTCIWFDWSLRWMTVCPVNQLKNYTETQQTKTLRSSKSWEAKSAKAKLNCNVTI